LGLPSLHAEHIFGRDGERGRRDGFQDELILEAALLRHPGRRLEDAIRLALHGSDAWDGVHPDEGPDAIVPALADARYAEKLAGRALVVRARAAKQRRALA
jgi:hypothetical protein